MSTCRKFEINRLAVDRGLTRFKVLCANGTQRKPNKFSYRMEMTNFLCTAIPYWLSIGKQAHATLLRLNAVLPIDIPRAASDRLVIAYSYRNSVQFYLNKKSN